MVNKPRRLKGQGLKAGQQTGVLPYSWPFKDKGECVQLDVLREAEAEQEEWLAPSRTEWGYLKTPGPGVHSYFSILQGGVKTLAFLLCTPSLVTCVQPSAHTDSTVPQHVPG